MPNWALARGTEGSYYPLPKTFWFLMAAWVPKGFWFIMIMAEPLIHPPASKGEVFEAYFSAYIDSFPPPFWPMSELGGTRVLGGPTALGGPSVGRLSLAGHAFDRGARHVRRALGAGRRGRRRQEAHWPIRPG
eukprot:scaffold127578_cov69-Phaeocystis_antarctica.AAC.6